MIVESQLYHKEDPSPQLFHKKPWLDHGKNPERKRQARADDTLSPYFSVSTCYLSCVYVGLHIFNHFFFPSNPALSSPSVPFAPRCLYHGLDAHAHTLYPKNWIFLVGKKERKKRGFVTRARVVPRSVQTALENLEKEREREGERERGWIIERRIESWKKGKNHASACMGDGLEETRMWGTVF